MSRSKHRGFTLIELMITVAIVAILAAVAYPSYQGQVRMSRRAAAQAYLMDVAARQQQRMVDVRSYADTLAALNTSPPAEISGLYTISVTVAAAPAAFTVIATPTGLQARDSGCSPLTLTNTGVQSPASCW